MQEKEGKMLEWFRKIMFPPGLEYPEVLLDGKTISSGDVQEEKTHK